MRYEKTDKSADGAGVRGAKSGVCARKSGICAAQSCVCGALPGKRGHYLLKAGHTMKRQHPKPELALPISLALHQQLCIAVCHSRFEKEDWEIAEIAIREWMARHDPDAFPMPAASGFQWKQLFLPDGTLLRTIFNGKNHHCRVEGGQVIHDGKASSPNRFANALGGTRRNAWEVIWIMLPQCQEWRRADALRPATQLPGHRTARVRTSRARAEQPPLQAAHRHAVDRRRQDRPLGN